VVVDFRLLDNHHVTLTMYRLGGRETAGPPAGASSDT
jgi:hypothetical protein